MGNYTDGMTMEEQIGQVMMVGFSGSTPSQEIIDLIQRFHVGNIILFSRNVRDAQQVLELTQSLQVIAKEAGQPYPLLIAIDQENGIVQRLGEAVTIFPGNMALGAIGSEEVAYNIALATGREIKALGINMNLAPVVDVNNNPANPVIGVRSFGEDPQQVARLGAAMVKGYRAAGVLSCLKHFPGHGDTEVDSHLALPTIPYTFERLEALELVPFRRGIEAGAQSVMVAHISFPALTQQTMSPATLSSAIVQGLLREQIGFNGVILSDCMEMKAISETFGTERAAVMALQAGIDLVLMSHLYNRQRGSIEAIQVAVQTQELSPQAVQQAAERVLRLKGGGKLPIPSLLHSRPYGLSWNEIPGSRAEAVECRFIEHVSPSLRAEASSPTPLPTTPAPTAPAPTAPTTCIGCEAHVQLQNQAYELSTTLVRNEDALLPLDLTSGQRIVVLSPQRNTMTIVEDRYYSDVVLADIIERYHTPVKVLSIAPGTVESACGELLQTTSESDIFVVVTVNAHLDEGQAKLVRYLISSGRRVVGIAVRNPYDLLAFPQLRTYLVTYEYTRPALVAAARVLFGERQAQGHLPVSLHPRFPPRDD